MINTEKQKEACRKWEAKNKDKRRKDHIKWRIKNPEKTLWLSARNTSRKRELEFAIKSTDINIPETCPILGIKLTHLLGVGRKGRPGSNHSLDRIDSSKGYTKDNIQVISDLANRMKQNASKEQLILFAKGILKYYGEVI